MSDKLRCPICGMFMLLSMDTWLCPECDWYQLWYLNVYTKEDLNEKTD